MTKPHGGDFAPTPYAELNGVLAHLVEGAQSILRNNFLGAYLQGSFAVGDATPYSDRDFIIVTHRDITPDELPALQALHAGAHELSWVVRWRLRERGVTLAGPAPSALIDPIAAEELSREVRVTMGRRPVPGRPIAKRGPGFPGPRGAHHQKMS